MAALLSMKEVTQITGATESALRYYNAKGVLMPTVREETGRRQWFYDDEAILKLKRLSLLKYLGLTIEEAGQRFMTTRLLYKRLRGVWKN